jgi:hypothetical protein
MSKVTVGIEQQSVNDVKRVIIGTSYTIGEFYEQAAKEKIDRDRLKNIKPTSY